MDIIISFFFCNYPATTLNLLFKLIFVKYGNKIKQYSTLNKNATVLGSIIEGDSDFLVISAVNNTTFSVLGGLTILHPLHGSFLILLKSYLLMSFLHLTYRFLVVVNPLYWGGRTWETFINPILSEWKWIGFELKIPMI